MYSPQRFDLRLRLGLRLGGFNAVLDPTHVQRERHDSFKERVKSVDHDHHESGQGEGQPVVL